MVFKTSRPVLVPDKRNNVAHGLRGCEGFRRLLDEGAFGIELQHEGTRSLPRAIYLSDTWVRAARRGRAG